MGKRSIHFRRLVAAGMLLAPYAYANSDLPVTWDLCPSMTVPARSFEPPASFLPSSTFVTADHIESRNREFYFLEGNAKILQEEQWIEAARATYNQDTSEVIAEGNVLFGQTDFSLTGTRLQFNADQYSGHVSEAAYFLPTAHAQGDADAVQFENENVIRLHGATYSTCLGENPDWALIAPQVKLDRESGFGSASNVTLRFYNIPVFYFPYINFPITADRKSGFLYPGIGYSDVDGFEVITPYYVNLAPNYDLTLTPRSLWRRGVMLEGAARYLTKQSTGTIDFGYLGNDKHHGGDRKSLAFLHQGTPAPNFKLDVNANYVSDRDYLDDFGNSINATTTDHLDRVATLTHKINRTTSLLRLRSFQTVDPDLPAISHPYRQLPQLLVSSSHDLANRRAKLQLNGEFVNFEHEVLPSTRRIDLAPEIRVPFRRPAGFITPSLALSYSQYEVEDSVAGSPTTFTRSLPIASVDSGIFLERDVSLDGNAYLQTLEPRLFYTYIPYEDQSDIPLFDSGLTTFSYGQMFRPNRFSGTDRIGDANQLTAALTTRLYESATGLERFNVSAGQVFYFQDRRVNITGDAVTTLPRSNIAAQSNLRLSRRLRLRADSLYDPFTERFDRSGIRLQYKDTRFRLINIGYRLNYGSTEQTDYSFAWPLSSRWWFAARWLRDYRLGRSLEIVEGLQYSSCCWNARLLSRRQYNATNDKVDGHIMLELEFKGLASTGKSVISILDESIAGFAEPKQP